jgi:hypothetical protein
VLTEMLLQFDKRPGREGQSYVLWPRRRSLDDQFFDVASVDSWTAWAWPVCKAGQTFALITLHPFVGVRVMEIGELAGLADVVTRSQLPDKKGTSVQSGWCVRSAKQSLQFQQIVDRKRRKNEGSIHNESFLSTSWRNVKRNIAVFLCHATRGPREALSCRAPIRPVGSTARIRRPPPRSRRPIDGHAGGARAGTR